MPNQYEGQFLHEAQTIPEKLRLTAVESKLPQGTTVEYQEDERTHLRVVELTLPEHAPLPLPEVMWQLAQRQNQDEWRFTETRLAEAHIITHRNIVLAESPTEFTHRYAMQAIRLRTTDPRAQDWHFEPKGTTVDDWVVTAHGPVEPGYAARQVPTRVAAASNYIHEAGQTLEKYWPEIQTITTTAENAHFFQGLKQAIAGTLNISKHLAPGAKAWRPEDYEKVIKETGLVPGSRDAQIAAVLFNQYKWQNLLPPHLVEEFEAALQPAALDVPWAANTALFVHNWRSVHAQANYPHLIARLAATDELANQPQIIALHKEDIFGRQ